jgi:ATP phosphoribosyltransferase regulatory subunit HisZ
LAIDFFRASLQNMDYEGYQNTGIRFPSEDEGTSLLDCLLHMRNNSKEACRNGYEIGTLHELYSDTDPGYYAMSQLEKIKPFLEKYVSFDLSMLSQYQYYTGIIFQGYTYGSGEPLIKGGRYDKLLEHFMRPAPAIGFALVMEQVMNALNRHDIDTVRDLISSNSSILNSGGSSIDIKTALKG